MGKLRKISLILLMLGFVFGTSACATGGYTSHRNNSGVKSSWHKSAGSYKPHKRMKAHPYKHKKHSNKPVFRHR